jgi:endonuclease/exonuclease/phosphatase family metal-dependent hydrolase
VKNTARVIRDVNADIMCLVEIESRPVLKRFASERLGTRYPYNRLVDGNDNRGIDVGLLSKIEPMGMWTHIDDKRGNTRIFSRDCLEVRLAHRAGFDIWLLLNHFKSKGYGSQATSNARRRGQAQQVASILSEYNLRRDYVVVAGDLNDTPDSAPLAPLMGVPDLYDVLAEVFPNPADRWTYHYRRNEQIDYLLVSRPLQRALQDADIERRGIFDVESYSNNAIRSYNSVTSSANAASDHGAAWADFRIP